MPTNTSVSVTFPHVHLVIPETREFVNTGSREVNIACGHEAVNELTLQWGHWAEDSGGQAWVCLLILC